MNRRPGRASGFTLIELMIVIAVAAILVALAVPAYKDYTIRAKVAECIAGAAVPKIQISEYQQSTGLWPANATEAGIDSSVGFFGIGLSQYCRIHFYNNTEGDFAVWVDSAAISATLSGTDIIPVLSPVLNGQGGTDWYCTRGFTDLTALKYLPTNCRGTNIY